MDTNEIRLGPEPHIEVHKYYGGVVAGAVVSSLVLQAFLPVHLRSAGYLELPLLITLYFALSRRNPSSGLLLGMVVGLLQDSLSPQSPLGVYGIAKTLVGFAGSSIGSRIDVEHPVSRLLLTVAFFLFHRVVFVLIHQLLLAQHETYLTVPILIASMVNALLAVGIFPLLDRFRMPS